MKLEEIGGEKMRRDNWENSLSSFLFLFQGSEAVGH